MSAIDNHQQRPWWPLAKSSSSKDPFASEKPSRKPTTHQKPNPLSFGALASAIGLKPKKQHPSLSIQHTAFPVASDSSSEPQSATSNRPSSKATTSSRSRTDSMEPRTPVDSHRDRRRSLLTLSDTDPFAVRPVITVPSPNLPSDPNRLSAFSNTSVTDLSGKRPDPSTFNRVSYASSSNSHYPPEPSPFATTLPLNINKDARRLHTKHSTGSLQVKKSDMLSRQSSLSPSVVSANHAPSSFFGDRNTSATNEGKFSRPRTRPRGLTDGGMSSGQKAGFFVEERHNTARKASKTPSLTLFPSPTHSPDPSKEFTTSPRVVIRQPSVSRLFSPPTAPPTQSLPAPPASPPQPTPDEQFDIIQGPSLARTESASSCISFASSVSLVNNIYTTTHSAGQRPAEKRSSPGHSISIGSEDDPGPSRRPTTAPSSPRTLKKTVSHQSLSRRPSSAPKSPPDPPITSSASSDKSFRKQRSFHHPRLPIPPIPISLRSSDSSSTNTATFPASNDANSLSGLEKRRGSATSSTGPGRRRLFSSSSRDKASTPHSQDNDDTRSFLSSRSEVESTVLSFKPWLVTHLHPHPSTQPLSPQPPTQSSSFWDETASEHVPGSPVRTHTEYTPQPILSPTERARLEASVALSSPSPSRHRALSTSTVTSDGDKETDLFVTALSPRPKRPISKQSSVRASDLSMKPPLLFAVPQSPDDLNRSRDLPGNPVSPHSTRGRDHSPTFVPFPHGFRNDGDTASVAGSHYTVRPASSLAGLPPPPRSRQHSHVAYDSRPSTAPGLSAPGANLSRQSTRTNGNNPSVVDKTRNRHSIMKKASFLDIDDDSDKDVDSGELSSSFLDLARESFDTTRSGDDM